jgi:hypothetical protein
MEPCVRLALCVLSVLLFSALGIEFVTEAGQIRALMGGNPAFAQEGEEGESAPPEQEQAQPEEPPAENAQPAQEIPAEETAAEEPVAAVLEEAEVAKIPPPPLAFTHPSRRGIPEAFLLPEKWLSFSYLRRSFEEDSIASQGSIESSGFKLDYGLTDKVQVSLRLWQNDTNNGRAIVVPFWDDTITADLWETDVRINLSGSPRPEPGPIPADKLPNAFTVGVSHQDSTLSREDNDDDLRMLTGYLSYSAYLNPQLATHTYFSTGRFTGDLLSGTMNTLGAGLDYDILPERDKLRMYLDGSLDIYNFRQTSFSATRVTHVNVGLCYMVTPWLEVTAGYGLHSDSDSDLSATEYQLGLSFVGNLFGGSKSKDSGAESKG